MVLLALATSSNRGLGLILPIVGELVLVVPEVSSAEVFLSLLSHDTSGWRPLKLSPLREPYSSYYRKRRYSISDSIPHLLPPWIHEDQSLERTTSFGMPPFMQGRISERELFLARNKARVLPGSSN